MNQQSINYMVCRTELKQIFFQFFVCLFAIPHSAKVQVSLFCIEGKES
jgi:hypothetical protein